MTDVISAVDQLSGVSIDSTDGTVTIYVTGATKADLIARNAALCAALVALREGGTDCIIRPRLVRGGRIWRTVIGAYGACRGFADQWRCGYSVTAAAA